MEGFSLFSEFCKNSGTAIFIVGIPGFIIGGIAGSFKDNGRGAWVGGIIGGIITTILSMVALLLFCVIMTSMYFDEYYLSKAWDYRHYICCTVYLGISIAGGMLGAKIASSLSKSLSEPPKE